MGLTVKAASRARFVCPHWFAGKREHDEDHWLVHGQDYPERLDGLAPGWYEPQGEIFHFWAGSYGSYNRWRRRLSLLMLRVPPAEVWASPDNYRGQPFVELINFTDSAGAIGPRTSANLAADFIEHAPPTGFGTTGFPEWEDVGADYFVRVYRDFTKAFELAAGGGVVVFA